ncbi:hypothetical protein [Methylomicrobium sp. Wu6]|nr:hypothetical protein [Methylomicrobium sp. Wu6]MEC4748750.1 hypothetical protein [Methylomicrobium sp. Wu6]
MADKHRFAETVAAIILTAPVLAFSDQGFDGLRADVKAGADAGLGGSKM